MKKKVTISFTPFKKYPDYFWLYLGQFISFFGSMITYVAIPYQMYSLTQSSTMVGAIGLVQLGPIIFFGLMSGAWADHFNRKKVVIFASFLGALGNVALIIFCISHSTNTLVLYLLAALMSSAKSIERPSMEAMIQSIIPKADLALISPLGSLKSNSGIIIGPALGGILIASFGIVATYCIDLLTFLIAIICILKIKKDITNNFKNSQHHKNSRSSHFNSVWLGMKYAWARPVLMGSYLIDILAMSLAFPNTLFPAMSYGPQHQSLLGWYYAAPAIGGLMGVFFSGWTTAIKSHGKAITWCAFFWCVGIIFFSFTFGTVAGFCFLAMAGLFDMYSGVFRSTLWNEIIESHFRGRLAGVEMISYTLGPILGGSIMGVLSDWVGAQRGLCYGGVIGSIMVLFCGMKLKLFWQYRSEVT